MKDSVQLGNLDEKDRLQAQNLIRYPSLAKVRKATDHYVKRCAGMPSKREVVATTHTGSFHNLANLNHEMSLRNDVEIYDNHQGSV